MHSFTVSTVDLTPGNLIVWLIVGALAGWISGRIMGGGFGFVGDMLVGIFGAFIGSFLIGLFVSGAVGFWGTMVVAIIGSCLLTGLLRLFTRGTTSINPRLTQSPIAYQPPPARVAYPTPQRPPQPWPPVASPAISSTVRVFVSHSHKDETITMQLVRDLQRAGASVWVDVADLQSGDFMQRIDAALSATDWVVLMQSPNSLQSPAVRMEINAALNLTIQNRLRGVIPFIIVASSRESVPATWSTLHYYDATMNYQAALHGLLRALGLVG